MENEATKKDMPWTNPPWTLDEKYVIVTANEGRTFVCDAQAPGRYDFDKDKAFADARLIAQAPLMAALFPDVIHLADRYHNDADIEDLANRAAIILHAAGGEDLRPTDRPQVRAADELLAALRVVAGVIVEEEPTIADQDWNQDAHVQIVLTVGECRQVLVAVARAEGKVEGWEEEERERMAREAAEGEEWEDDEA